MVKSLYQGLQNNIMVAWFFVFLHDVAFLENFCFCLPLLFVYCLTTKTAFVNTIVDSLHVYVCMLNVHCSHRIKHSTVMLM